MRKFGSRKREVVTVLTGTKKDLVEKEIFSKRYNGMGVGPAYLLKLEHFRQRKWSVGRS